MTVILFIGLAALVYYVLKNRDKAGGSPKEQDPTNIRYYMKDQNILPNLEKFDVRGMEWWPSSIVAKDNWCLEQVKFARLHKSEDSIEVGGKLLINCWRNKVNVDPNSYGDAFDNYQDGMHLNEKMVSGKLTEAIKENRLEARVRQIDEDEKEVDVVLYALDKPLPWMHKQAKGFSIPKKSFDKLLDEAETAEELDAKLKDWWMKRDQRLKKKAEKSAK